MRSRGPGAMVLLTVLATLLALLLAVMQVALGREWRSPIPTGACEIGCFPGGLTGVAAVWALTTVLVGALAVYALGTRSTGQGAVLLLATVLLLAVVPLDPFPVLGRWIVLSSARSEPLVRLVLAGACCVVAAVLLAWESVALRRTTGEVRAGADPTFTPAAPGTGRRPPPPASPRRSRAAFPLHRPPRRSTAPTGRRRG